MLFVPCFILSLCCVTQNPPSLWEGRWGGLFPRGWRFLPFSSSSSSSEVLKIVDEQSSCWLVGLLVCRSLEYQMVSSSESSDSCESSKQKTFSQFFFLSPKQFFTPNSFLSLKIFFVKQNKKKISHIKKYFSPRNFFQQQN